MSDTKNDLIVLVASLAIAPVAVAWRAYALSLMWGWFIVSTFHVPAITSAQALGVSMVAATITIGVARDEDKDDSIARRVSRACLKAFLTPVMMIAFSYPVTWFLP